MRRPLHSYHHVPGMGFLGWYLTSMGSLALHGGKWVGVALPRPRASLSHGPEGGTWEGHYTFLAGAGTINWGAGATIVTTTDRRAVGAVGPCCTGNCTDLSLQREGADLGSAVALCWVAVAGRIVFSFPKMSMSSSPGLASMLPYVAKGTLQM
jgi:hypothetical protein